MMAFQVFIPGKIKESWKINLWIVVTVAKANTGWK